LEQQPEVPLTLYFQKGMSVSPASLAFQASGDSPDRPTTRSATLRMRHRGVKITRVTSSDPDLTLKLAPTKVAGVYRLSVTCADLSQIDKPAAIVAETNDPHQPAVSIPVHVVTGESD
jgi:hypothetical protein